MKPDDVTGLYDAAYAASYDRKFLEAPMAEQDTRHELDVVRASLVAGLPWLDAGCGTGYFLSRFPEVERAGIDLSPAMLDAARAANPGAELRQHDFREPIREWRDRFGLVTCMWYAYAYVDTIDEVGDVIANLSAWTAPTGRCFVPLCDPQRITRCEVPYAIETGWGGPVTITGVLWSFSDEAGTKHHRHLVSPAVEWMCEQFGRWFEDVAVFVYPSKAWGERPGLIANRKRA